MREMNARSSADRPVCTWVAVTDAAGRTYMEARWTTAAALAQMAA